MKYTSIYCSAFLSVLLGSLTCGTAAHAVAFDQQELDQSKVIAVAVPLPQGERYNLLILEQLNSSRACWQDTNTPGVIEPLLLKFDFTNICGRSTDSNGYSVRMAGQDRAMDYRLSVIRIGDRIVLQGIPARGNRGAALNIAQANVVPGSFVQLRLNSGWRFTKRSYQGKTLGHIYLTRDTEPGERDNFIATRPTATPATPSQSPTQLWRNRRNYQASLPTPRFRRTTALTGPVTIPVPSPMATSTLASAGVFPPPMRSGSGDVLPVLPVPNGNIPLGNAGNEPDLITASNAGNLFGGVSDPNAPPPPMRSLLGMPRYRLFVDSEDAALHLKAKGLVKDAFRSFYHGHRYLQVGAFQERSEADHIINLLSSNGIPTKLVDESPN